MIGVVGSALSLMALWKTAEPTSGTLSGYALFFLLFALFQTFCSTAYNGLLVDKISKDSRGGAAGIMAGSAAIASVVAGALGLLYTQISGMMLMLILVSIFFVTMIISVVIVKEKQFEGTSEFPYGSAFVSTMIAPFRSSDFCLVFLSRFCFQFGFCGLQGFAQFYIDESGIAKSVGMSAESAASVVMLVIAGSAILGAAVGGKLSDIGGGQRRKIWLYLGGSLAALISFLIPFVRMPLLGCVLLIVFGAGIGCFLAVDFALLMDILPNKDEYAKDVAVFNQSLVLPVLFAPTIDGFLRDIFQQIGRQCDTSVPPVCVNPDSTLGYDIIFWSSSIFLALGTLLITCVRTNRAAN